MVNLWFRMIGQIVIGLYMIFVIALMAIDFFRYEWNCLTRVYICYMHITHVMLLKMCKYCHTQQLHYEPELSNRKKIDRAIKMIF